MAEKAEAQATKAEEPQAEKSGDGKRKKITKLSLQEIEKEIKFAQEKMGGLHSVYGRHLLARKKELSESDSRN